MGRKKGSTPHKDAAPTKAAAAHAVLPARRHCTDILFLLIFLGAVGLTLGAYEYGQRNGDLDKILYGLDYKGDLCGVDNSENATGLPPIIDVSFSERTVAETLWPLGAPPRQDNYRLRRGQRDHRGKPYLYMSFPGEARDSTLLGGWASAPIALCVSRCPTLNESELALAGVHHPGAWICSGEYSNGPPANCPDGGGDAPECLAYRNAYFLNAPPNTLAACLDPMGDCNVCFPRYHTLTALTFCLPEPRALLGSMDRLTGGLVNAGAKLSANSTQTAISMHDVRRFVSSLPHILVGDVRVAAPAIGLCVALAFCFGLIWLLLVRLFSGAMVYVSLFTAVLGLSVGCWQLWEAQKKMREDARYGVDERFARQADAAHLGFWALLVLTLIFLLFVYCVRRSLSRAVRVIGAASMALAALPLLTLLPVILIAISLSTLVGGVYVGAMLISSGELQRGRQGFGHLAMEAREELLLALHVVCAVWFCVFVRHVQHCTVAGGISSWFFAAKGDRRVYTREALCNALRYHAGSIALGSLLLAALRLVKGVYYFVRNRIRAILRCFNIKVSKRSPASRGKTSGRCIAACACCLACFERFLRTLSRYAYAQVVISGRPFCPSAFEAFRTLTANIAGAAALHLIGSSFILLGKLFVAAACAAIGWLILVTNETYAVELYSIYTPVVVIGIASFMVASLFFGVYSMAVDTLFLCACADKERGGDGKGGRGGGAKLQLLMSEDGMPEEVSVNIVSTDPHDMELVSTDNLAHSTRKSAAL